MSKEDLSKQIKDDIEQERRRRAESADILDAAQSLCQSLEKDLVIVLTWDQTSFTTTSFGANEQAKGFASMIAADLRAYITERGQGFAPVVSALKGIERLLSRLLEKQTAPKHTEV